MWVEVPPPVAHRPCRLLSPLAAAPALRPHACCLPQIVEVSAEELEAEILGRDRPLIIDFFATWCGPCVLLAKELETVRPRLPACTPAAAIAAAAAVGPCVREGWGGGARRLRRTRGLQLLPPAAPFPSSIGGPSHLPAAAAGGGEDGRRGAHPQDRH